jgi:hypothetical protein
LIKYFFGRIRFILEQGKRNSPAYLQHAYIFPRKAGLATGFKIFGVIHNFSHDLSQKVTRKLAKGNHTKRKNGSRMISLKQNT